MAGRRLLVFEKAEGEKTVWWGLSPDKKVRANAIRFFQLPVLIFSPELSSCLDSPYPCIIVQLQSPAWLCHILAPRTPISTPL